MLGASELSEGKGNRVNPNESRQLDPALLTRWYRDHSQTVRAFLIGLLRDPACAEEAFQATYTKALTHGGDVQEGAERAWLFQVAYHEAMAIRRRQGVDQRARTRIGRGWNGASADSSTSAESQRPEPIDDILRWETVHQVQSALSQLSQELRQVVEKRIYEDKTFQQIADELQIPLGTALTRMRTALSKLQAALGPAMDSDA